METCHFSESYAAQRSEKPPKMAEDATENCACSIRPPFDKVSKVKSTVLMIYRRTRGFWYVFKGQFFTICHFHGFSTNSESTGPDNKAQSCLRKSTSSFWSSSKCAVISRISNSVDSLSSCSINLYPRTFSVCSILIPPHQLILCYQSFAPLIQGGDN